jgi:hypothetical protein
MTEIRPVPSLPGAWASDDGVVFRPYKGYTAPGADYAKVTVRGKSVSVHRAVCEAFHGPPPTPIHQAAHLDGDPTNNSAANLVWATPKENAAHCVAHGTAQRGALHYASKVTERDVRVIRRARRIGISEARLSARFGISRATVGNINAGRTWAHVSE